MSSLLLHGLALCLLAVSWMKDQQKTRKALKKGWNSFCKILPQMLMVLLLVDLVLTLLTPETISRLIGSQSGAAGTLLAAGVGAITLIPGFVAFPLAEALLGHGAGITQIAAFVSMLMMVGIVTLPMETETIGRRPALLRNSLAFLLGSATAGPLYASFPVAAVTAKKGTSLFNILVFLGAGCSCNKMTQQCPQNYGKI